MVVESDDSYRLPPEISRTLVEVTDNSGVEDALNKVLISYLDAKIEDKRDVIEGFEQKWGMDFEEFKDRTSENNLPDDSDPYSREVEKDFREWEAAVTLLQKYKSARKELS